MPAIHRHDDSRACGATTVASQETGTKKVFIGGKLVSNVGDPAGADGLCPPLGGAHCGPSTTSGLETVIVGEA